MQRIHDEFLAKLEQEVSLTNLSVLEVGCGDGTRSQSIAKRCGALVGIDPDERLIEQAINLKIGNAMFSADRAEHIPFHSATFDLVLFALSLHHVPPVAMSRALDEAVRVVKKSGHIVVLEPTEKGTFFEAELRFDACDGDERAAKQAAREALAKHRGLLPVIEFDDETIFQFDSAEDFRQSLLPKKNLEEIEEFLTAHEFTLTATRHTNIYRPRR